MNKVDQVVADLVEAQSENAELRRKLDAFMGLRLLVPCPPEITPDELVERLQRMLAPTSRAKYESAARSWWMVRAVAREIDHRLRAEENYPDRKLDVPPLPDNDQLTIVVRWMLRFYGKDSSGVRLGALRRLHSDPETKEFP